MAVVVDLLGRDRGPRRDIVRKLVWSHLTLAFVRPFLKTILTLFVFGQFSA